MKNVKYGKCVRCGKTYDAVPDLTNCECGGILDIVYDYDYIKKNLTKEKLKARPNTMWRYRELLPVEETTPDTPLRVGWSPLYEEPRLASQLGLKKLWVKDDGINPTASLKDRASAMAVAKAGEAGAKIIACSSTGNAASSLAGNAAAAGFKTYIFVPERAPKGKVAQLMTFGANVISVKGNYEETFELSKKAIDKWGWYNRNAAINPYLSEGKKTVSIEIAEQLDWKMPDYLAISVGDGCTIAGVWKGLKDLYAIGFIDKLPRLISAQAEGCHPINRAIAENKPWEPMEENTIADSIAVGVPRNADKALMAIRESNGIVVNVTDEEIMAAQKLLGKEYPREALHGGWETILLNQFHDIIPGSSIKEVYEVSHRQYEKIGEAGKRIKNDAETAVAENINTRGGVLVFNPNSFEASGETKLDGKTVYVKNIPPKGYKVVTDVCNANSVKVTDKFLENRFFKIKLDKTGAFSSLFDKKNKREVLKKGERGNVLTAYEDIPRDYDNWEISNYYTDKSWEVDSVVSIKPLSDGVRAGIEITRRFLSSTIVQRIWLYENTPKIDFENDIDWKESHILLKTAFPTDINADKATYDIQFGTVERPTHKNTSWDAAKFEVCAHKFADLSEYGYGVSLLNDCKYGYDIHDSVIRLTLIKCGNYPNPDADKCRHEFTYSLFPHSGDFREAGTVKLAYLLNSPLEAKKIESQNGSLPEEYSLLSIDSENVICETVKNAEDGDGVIVRLYECCNSRANVNLTLGFDFDNVYLTDLLENEERKLRKHGRTVNLTLKPFEIVTLKLK